MIDRLLKFGLSGKIFLGYSVHVLVGQFNGQLNEILACSALNARKQLFVLFDEGESSLSLYFTQRTPRIVVNRAL